MTDHRKIVYVEAWPDPTADDPDAGWMLYSQRVGVVERILPDPAIVHDAIPAQPGPTWTDCAEHKRKGGFVERWNTARGAWSMSGRMLDAAHFSRLAATRPNVPQPDLRLVPIPAVPEVPAWVQDILDEIKLMEPTPADLAAIAQAVTDAQETK